MLFTKGVWAIYGVLSRPDESCVDCVSEVIPQITRRDATLFSSDTSLVGATPSGSVTTTHALTSEWNPDATSAPSSESDQLSTAEATPSATSATRISLNASNLSTSTTGSAQELETGVKIGIGVIVGIIGLGLILILVDACYLRRKRREKALEQAVQEVERGERELELSKGSEEAIVLESRVSIVFHEVSEDEEEAEGYERGRSGMSLARRNC